MRDNPSRSHQQVEPRALGILFVGLQISKLFPMSVQLGRQLVAPLASEGRTLQTSYRRLVELLVLFSINVNPMPVAVRQRPNGRVK